MSINDSSVGQPNDERSGDSLELLTDDERTWTLVPTDATGDERLTHWISADSDVLCNLEEWR